MAKKTTSNAKAAQTKKLTAAAAAKQAEQAEPKPITKAQADKLVALGILTEEERAKFEAEGKIRAPGSDFIPSDAKADVKKLFEAAQRFNDQHPSMSIAIRLTVANGAEKKSRKVIGKMVGVAVEGDDEA